MGLVTAKADDRMALSCFCNAGASEPSFCTDRVITNQSCGTSVWAEALKCRTWISGVCAAWGELDALWACTDATGRASAVMRAQTIEGVRISFMESLSQKVAKQSALAAVIVNPAAGVTRQVPCAWVSGCNAPRRLVVHQPHPQGPGRHSRQRQACRSHAPSSITQCLHAQKQPRSDPQADAAAQCKQGHGGRPL